MGNGSPDDGFRFRRIGRTDDGHIGQAAHESQVFDGLVRRPVFADTEAGMSGTDFDIEPRQADGVANLFKRPARAEDGKGAGQGNLAASGKAGSRPHHILFGNAHVEVAFRRDLLKSDGPRRRAQVGVEDDDLWIFIQFRF